MVHHIWLGKLMLDFKHDRNRHGHKFYRWINEIPALPVLLGAVLAGRIEAFSESASQNACLEAVIDRIVRHARARRVQGRALKLGHRRHWL